MRDFFIRAFEIIVGVFIVLIALGVVLGGVAVLFIDGPEGTPSGVLGAVLIWGFGGIYVLFIGGALYLGLGIYQNTKRTAEILERMAERP